MLMETGPCCSADIKSASVVSPHFCPPTDFQPDSAPLTSAPFFFEQGESSHRSHWVPFPFHSGARHGKASRVQTVWLTANFRALKFQPPLQPSSTQSTNSCSEKLLRCFDIRGNSILDEQYSPHVHRLEVQRGLSEGQAGRRDRGLRELSGLDLNGALQRTAC